MSFGIPVRNGLAIGLLASTTLSSRRGLSPAMSLDFLQPFLDSRITFSRGTTATFVGNNGFIQTAAIDAPRFDYDPVTLAPKGLLIEEARTNLLLYSEQFNNVYWTPTGATVSANTTSSPDGTVNADSLVEDTSTAVHRVFATPACSVSTVYTYTAYIKAAGRTEVRLLETTLGGAFFNLSTVAIITTDAGVTASIQDAGNGWRRCRITATTGAAQVLFVAQIQASAASNTIYTGNGTTALYLYGAQLEAGSFATSYIPTVASTVTRSADVATMTGTNFSSWFNPVEGTFVTSADAIATGANRVIVGAPTLVFPNYIRSTNQGGAFDTANVAATANVITTAVFKLATTYGSSTLQACLDGGTAASTSYNNIFASLTAVGLGSNAAGGAFLNGHIRQIAYYNTRLPNAQLQTLTAPSLATTLSLSFTNQAYTVGV